MAIISEREIAFNLTHLTKPVTEEFLLSLEGFLKFETILTNVDLPRFPPLTNGLDSYKMVFDWLRKMGVRKILGIRVKDDGEIPISDEVIEDALDSFGLERWDWKKLDLCSETIFRVAPDVREVFLYCSGNDAVLRSWSCYDGLAKLGKVSASPDPIFPRLSLITDIQSLSWRRSTLQFGRYSLRITDCTSTEVRLIIKGIGVRAENNRIRGAFQRALGKAHAPRCDP